MMRPIKFLHAFELDFYFTPSAILGLILPVLLFSWLGSELYELSTGEAILSGLIGLILYWLPYFMHHLGHAIAARQVGYPMQGVMMYYIFARSLYPSNEPILMPIMHIRRALGGPIISLFLTIFAAFIALFAIPAEGFIAWLAVLFLGINVFLLVGALTPLPFWIETDMNTILKWRRKQAKHDT